MEENKVKVGFDIIKHTILGDNETCKIKWHKIPIEIKKNLALDETAAFIYGAVDACFSNDLQYSPENLDPAVRAATVVLYTNIGLPDNEFEQYELLYSTDIIPFIYEHIDQDQYDAAINAINRSIDYRVDVRAREFQVQFDEFKNTMAEVTKQFSELFDGVDSKELSTIIDVMSNAKLDEEKLVQAYLDSKKEDQ